MSKWDTSLLVVQAIVEKPDGSREQAEFNLPANGMKQTGMKFVGARVFPVFTSQREGHQVLRIENGEKVNVDKGSLLIYAGEPVDAKMEAPTRDAELVKDRLEVQKP